MQYGKIQHFQTGVGVPVSSLRTGRSCGNGEFTDLVELGRWCQGVGLDLIQILPVHDTEGDPSPYACLSAFALHPIYVRLEDVDGGGSHAQEIAAARARLEPLDELDYHATLKFKFDLLYRIYERRDVHEVANSLSGWIAENPWLRRYCCYRILKEDNGGTAWWDWGEFASPTDEQLHTLWQRHEGRMLFHAWVQHVLHEQLSSAAHELDAMGIKLKGDVPILLAEDSVDVWTNPSVFRRDVRAGAPPDMFATRGQNWGFPSYDWNSPATSTWWLERLHHASRYYHAFRIDHVLGFFRIWEIPRQYEAGMLGAFHPPVSIPRERLHEVGFDDPQIDAFLAPGGRVGESEAAEGEILALEDPGEVQRQLDDLWDRILLSAEEPAGTISLVPRWDYDKTRQFEQLDEEQQNALRGLVAENERRQEEQWAETGRQRLGPLANATSMLPCAEDLGAAAACVPPVLGELGILRLCVERWCWNDDGTLTSPEDYPRLSVGTPSTHDTSTLRGWWNEERGTREPYAAAIGIDPIPDDLAPDDIRRVLERNLTANSILCVIPMQEFFALDEELRPDEPDADRINVPATASEHNWSYRLPQTLEALRQRDSLSGVIRELIAPRRSRELES